MKGFGKQNNSKKKKVIKKKNNPSIEKIINQAIQFQLQGKISKAANYYQNFINQGLKDHRIFSNYGVILEDLGKRQEAEVSYRKAIEIEPDFAMAHCNLGNILKDLGKLKDAELSTRKAIEIEPDFAEAYSNLGNILKDFGKLQDAELPYRKAIQLNPNLAEAHFNLGILLRDLGKLNEAELSLRKAIALKPDFAEAYFSLSTLQYSNENKIWKDQLFSDSILKNKSQKNLVNFYFARANILHKEKNYEDSSKFLKLANQIKLILHPSKADSLINKSKVLLIESDKQEINQKEYTESPKSIFIVGMPRSGSTLLESILSMNNNVYDLGEKNIFEMSFLNWKKPSQKSTLADLYFKGANTSSNKIRTITNKWLYNYQYTGIIATNIPESKIIHCFRNPLDNILSIYRANFARGNTFASSLVDCAKVYLDQEEVMTAYKKRFRSTIYDLNYDLLVQNPNKEIKSLISWLGWDWHNQYLSPHLNPRSVSTASNIQVRYPINSKSVGGWKSYEEMLKPAMEILIQNEKYKNLKY